MRNCNLLMEIDSDSQVGIVRLSGSLHHADVSRVLDTLDRQLRIERVVVCDLTGLAAVDPSWLLLVLPTALRRQGGWPLSALHVVAPGKDLYDQIAHTRLHRYMPVHRSLKAAVTAATREVSDWTQEIRLPPIPSSVTTARLTLGRSWPELTGTELGREDALLVITELASNAVRHVGQPFNLAIRSSASNPSTQSLLVAVSDNSDQEPLWRPADQSEPDGRGLLLIAALSQQWGVRLVHPHGKTVWAEVWTSPAT